MIASKFSWKRLQERLVVVYATGEDSSGVLDEEAAPSVATLKQRIEIDAC